MKTNKELLSEIENEYKESRKHVNALKRKYILCHIENIINNIYDIVYEVDHNKNPYKVPGLERNHEINVFHWNPKRPEDIKIIAYIESDSEYADYTLSIKIHDPKGLVTVYQPNYIDPEDKFSNTELERIIKNKFPEYIIDFSE